MVYMVERISVVNDDLVAGTWTQAVKRLRNTRLSTTKGCNVAVVRMPAMGVNPDIFVVGKTGRKFVFGGKKRGVVR